MKVLLFGATGMVGQGVLRECLLAPDVESVTTVGRTSTWASHPKLSDIVRPNVFDLSGLEAQSAGVDACFFCLGVSSLGMTEEAYRRVAYELTLSVARTLVRLNPRLTFIYVSGAGTDSTEKGRSMWARVKGQTENALLRLPFKTVCMFRPGLIVPLHGARSKTRLVRLTYILTRPILPLLQLLPSVTTTEKLGRAMLRVAREGAPKPILGAADINALARPTS
jgi:uncharacterized protein YbjT (DUF2867 family)